MPDPVDSLDAPIDWRDAALWPILSDLQGNILKGHGRQHAQHICLRFDPERVADVRKAIRSLAANVTSALTQLRETSVYKIVGRSGGTAVHLAIAAAGYRAIRLTPPGNPAFLSGMAARAGDLRDPHEATWDGHLRGIHALLIVADDSPSLVAGAATFLTAGLADTGITILGRDIGQAPCELSPIGFAGSSATGHVGCVSRRAQPLLLADDVAAERATRGSFTWNPGFSPRDCALVRDPHGAFGESFGSYLIYRKLERKGAAGPHRDEALARSVGGQTDVRDRAAVPCPRAAVLDCERPAAPHVRDAYHHRDARVGQVGRAAPSHPMPRRVIRYGPASDGANEGGATVSAGAGLLFMAYNADIGRQFEYTRRSWIGDGVCVPDPRIGGHDTASCASPDAAFRSVAPRPPEFALCDSVTLKGGEYLFAPSLSALGAL